ncbi:MAG: hypothetical protein AB1Z31_12895, partial [Desulfobacterales bacterium]
MIDLVSMITIRRELIRSEISRADLLLGFLQENQPNSSAGNGEGSGLEPESLLNKMINDSQIASALFMKP